MNRKFSFGNNSSSIGLISRKDFFKNLLKKVIYELEVKKVYLDPKINIDSVAEILYTNRTYISKVINDEFHLHFNTYVNGFRIKEALKILADPDYRQHPLTDIATLAGFNNKTTFNTIFKKITGYTPSFYRDNPNLHVSELPK